MDAGIRREILRLRRRALTGLWLSAVARLALGSGFALGALTLILRSGFEITSSQAAWVLLPLALIPLAAFLLARRHLLSEATSAAWLDLRTGASGLILTDYELADDRWNARIRAELQKSPPPPLVDSLRPLSKAALGVGFALLSTWIALPAAPPVGLPPALTEHALEDLREKLETLEEEVELAGEDRVELEKRLEQVREESEHALTPEATFEAMDQLERRMEEIAAHAQEAAEQMAGALQGAAEEERSFEARQQELATAAQKLQQVGLAAKLDAALSAKLSANLALDSAVEFDMSALAELSAELQAALAERMGELAKAGLLKQGYKGKLGQLGEPGDLSQFADHECDEKCLTPGGL